MRQPITSKHAITVIIISWLVLTTYLLYDYSHYGRDIFNHLFSLDKPADLIQHIVILVIVIGCHITAYLITDRKNLLIKTTQSADKLRIAANEWKTTFDTMPYGVIMTDTNFNVIKSNRQIEIFSGIKKETPMKNRKCYEFICKEAQPHSDCPHIKALASKKTETSELLDTVHGKDFRESVTPVLDRDGNMGSTIHVLMDVTEAKKKENKLIQTKNAFFNMLKDLDHTYKELKNVHNNLIITFSNIIDAKSSWTKGHSMNVSTYSLAIANEIGLNTWDIETLKTASLLHDIGKVGTYDVILDKPEKLNDTELSLIRQHTLRGEEILRPIEGLEKVLPIIRSHHEHFDGSGYPDGLKGYEIPLLARIICVADSYDAMISNRPYRQSIGTEHAVSELNQYSNTQFDPKVVSPFLSLLNKGDTILPTV
jgi:putative nucleotidyltransferase with HDIG domain/PAS domain S-box-containing protein